MQIFAGVPWEGASLRQMKVWSLKMAIFPSFVHCHPIILHTWPHDSFQVMRLSMTLAILPGHVIRLFHIKFLIYGVRYGKSYYRILIGNHIAFDCCYFL